MSDLLTDDEEQRLRAFLVASFTDIEKRGLRQFDTLFPDEGEYRRELYQRHMEFFAAGAEFPERLFIAANRIGKTVAGAYEVTCHLTGRYPHWWPGKRFDTAGEWWACGTNSETTRDIVQRALFGKHDGSTHGMIPMHLIAETTRRPHGLPGSIEGARIRHISGEHSYIGLKTYEQGRKSFEGTEKQGIWCDEEPPADCYGEMVLRTMTTKGIVLVTFTPLQGRTEVVNGFLEPENPAAEEVKMFVQAGWDDVPHLDEAEKRRQMATMQPYLIEARTKGEPTLGAGAIYPIPFSDMEVDSFDVPWTWPRGYGLDVGWNRTAALFVTMDVGSAIYYAYDEHYLSQGEPSSHAQGIRARGSWMKGVIDPASRGRSQHDGRQLLQSYRDLGLDLDEADNSVEAGIVEFWTLMVSGRFKVMKKCQNFAREFRGYHRDEKGVIVKTRDHLMDAGRYWAKSGRDKMKVKPRTKTDRPPGPRMRGRTWMGT